MSGVALSCAGILVDAWREGQTPLDGQLPALQCHQKGRKRLAMTSNRCRQLEQKGYLIVDNFISPQEIRQVLHRVQQQKADFDISPNEKAGGSSTSTQHNPIRNDRVCLFRSSSDQSLDDDSEDGTDRDKGMSLDDVRNLLQRVGYDIATSSFGGFDAQSNDEVSSSAEWLGIPPMMQVAVYEPRLYRDEKGGDENGRVIGGFYRSHTDTCSQSFSELGLLGFLRSKYLRKRYLTCILYLNEDWVPSNGGCLRIFGSGEGVGGSDHHHHHHHHHHNDEENHANGEYNNNDSQNNPNTIDVEPLAGRLVIFSSKLTHAVLPTFVERIACSIWITRNT